MALRILAREVFDLYQRIKGKCKFLVALFENQVEVWEEPQTSAAGFGVSRKGRFLFEIASCLCQTDSLIMPPVGLSIWPNSQISAGQDKGLFAQQGSSVGGGGAGGRKGKRRFPPTPGDYSLWFTIKETVFSSPLSLEFMASIYFKPKFHIYQKSERTYSIFQGEGGRS